MIPVSPHDAVDEGLGRRDSVSRNPWGIRSCKWWRPTDDKLTEQLFIAAGWAACRESSEESNEFGAEAPSFQFQVRKFMSMLDRLKLPEDVACTKNDKISPRRR